MWSAALSQARTARVMAIGLALATPPGATAQLSGTASVTARAYPGDGPAGAPAHEQALTMQVERVWTWADGDQALLVEPYLRLDPATRSRSRFDFVDLAWEWAAPSWELSAGIRQIRWGVAESHALVEVVNQLDHAEDRTTAGRLGQPLGSVGVYTSFGTFDGLVIPLFRERDFAGRGATLWSPLPVADAALYESHHGRRHVDWALRWSHILGDFDVAVAHFAGTNRQPRFAESPVGSGPGVELVPVYDQMNQVMLEAQLTRNAWLVKLEFLRRSTRDEDFMAMVGGLEYAFADYLSVFAEYLYDERGRSATTSLENDVFVGARLLTQDWTVSWRTFVDHRSANAVVGLTASRRLVGVATLELGGRLFAGDEADEPSYATRLDSDVSVRLSYFF